MIRALLLLFISFVIVSYGQPAGIPWLSTLSALCGYALMCRVLLEITSAKQRFLIGTLWFLAVQAIQLKWLLYHPFNYIYFVYALFCILWGMQWGVLSIFIKPERLQKISQAIALASLWTLFEWSRLYFLSGYTWNPAGIALTNHLYSMQLASIGGIYLLSFWVILVNMMGLRAWFYQSKKNLVAWISLAAFPYLFGIFHFHYPIQEPSNPYRTLLVQTAFPAEEALVFDTRSQYVDYVIDEWAQIFKILHPYREKNIDLIALPEYVVPFATYLPIYPYEEVEKAITATYGESVKQKFPPLQEPFARQSISNQGNRWFVNNAFWAQAVANIFQSEVIAGLENVIQDENAKAQHYSAAIHFKPNSTDESVYAASPHYAKRILLPMAEYIPFSIFHNLAAKYGIQGSLTFGTEATVFHGSTIPFGVSICYEETFGNIMRECRQNGAELLVNLSSDVWYPNSNLPKQHFDLARLRSVENGVPIVRACNTGITTACDSFGQIIAMLGDTSPESQWIADALYVEVPRYHYPTIYSRFGNSPILLLCCLGVLFPFIFLNRDRKR